MTPQTQALSPRKQEFVLRYIADHNGIEAYKASHQETDNEQAKYRSMFLLRLPQIKEAIKAEEEQRANRLILTADTLMQERAALATASIGDLMDFSGEGLPQLKPANKISKLALKAVTSLKVNMGKDGKPESIEYKLANKAPHLDALETKYGIEMPDIKAQKHDHTVRVLESTETRRQEAMSLLEAWEQRAKEYRLLDQLRDKDVLIKLDDPASQPGTTPSNRQLEAPSLPSLPSQGEQADLGSANSISNSASNENEGKAQIVGGEQVTETEASVANACFSGDGKDDENAIRALLRKADGVSGNGQ